MDTRQGNSRGHGRNAPVWGEQGPNWSSNNIAGGYNSQANYGSYGGGYNQAGGGGGGYNQGWNQYGNGSWGNNEYGNYNSGYNNAGGPMRGGGGYTQRVGPYGNNMAKGECLIS